METPQHTRASNSGIGMPMTPTREHSTLLREQEAEQERLRMDNFNQALRINFLEERLLRMKQGTDFCSEDVESELAQLRILLEERDHDLRQRNFSMIRATEAIDMLNAQLHEAQAAAVRAREEAQRDAEAQFHQRMEERDNIDAETAAKWRAELDAALQTEHQSRLKAQKLEHELQRQEEVVAALKDDKEAAQRELDSVKVELCSHLSCGRQVLKKNRHHSVTSLVRETFSALKEEFETRTRALQACWKQHDLSVNIKLEHLASQLRLSQGKLEVLQRSSVHANDANQSLEKSWSIRCEELRLESDNERRSLEKEIRHFQKKAAEAQKTLFQASGELQTLKRSQKKLREESDRENYDLKESNRLLFEEVHERRRSTEHARKQYMKAVKENKELLKAIQMYKDAIAGRDKDIEKYKAMIIKYAQQLKRRVEFGDAKQTLLEQLEQTQYMIDETYKRWETSSLVCGPESSSLDKDASYKPEYQQLNDYINQMHSVAGRRVLDLDREIRSAHD